MAMDVLKNLAYGVVLLPPTPPNLGTSLTLASGHGARFPAAPFSISIWPFGVPADPTNTEIVRCTGKAGDVLTIQRQQEGTQLRTILAGDAVAQAMTGKFLTDLITDLHAYTDYVGNTLRVDMNNQDAAQRAYIDQQVAYATIMGHLPRVYRAASVAVAALDIGAYDMLELFAQSGPLTMAAPLGTPVEGQSMTVRIRDDGAANRAITWNAVFMSGIAGVALPASTQQWHQLIMGFRYSILFFKWQMVAVAQD